MVAPGLPVAHAAVLVARGSDVGGVEVGLAQFLLVLVVVYKVALQILVASEIARHRRHRGLVSPDRSPLFVVAMSWLSVSMANDQHADAKVASLALVGYWFGFALDPRMLLRFYCGFTAYRCLLAAELLYKATLVVVALLTGFPDVRRRLDRQVELLPQL